MARTSRPDSVFRISIHRNGGHTYAATHPYTIDKDGKRKYSVLHWGTVTEDLRFVPGKRFLQAPEDIRRSLIFPEGWDLSAIKGSGRGSAAHAIPFKEGDGGKAFGAVWLLERIGERFALREDLEEAFGPLADDLLTLAYYPFLTGMSFQRFGRWQEGTKAPSDRPLEEMVAGSLAGVSRAALHRFMDLRKERFAKERLCAVDSVVRYSMGSLVSDRRWGQKTERIHFHSTVQAVAYSLDSHIPVACSSFPEAVSDARGLGFFRSQLEKTGLGGIAVVTDRGYDSLQGLEPYFGKGPLVMCVDVKQPAVMERIEAFGRFRSHPAGMRYHAESRRWYRQYQLDGQGLRLNLFFNPERRAAELAQIDAGIASQLEALKEIKEYGITISDRRKLRQDFFFFNTEYDRERQTVVGFSPDKSRIVKSRAASGFYANITSGLDLGPLEAVSIYSLKYDQEKFLRQFLSLLEFPVNPAISLGMGIQVLQYIGLLLNTWLLHSFRPGASQAVTGKPLPYRSFMEILDDFHTVQCTATGDGTCAPAPFSQSQKQVLSVLGII